jgi:UDP:flavonoid glycosyltransferase YjiC (YdhE family)
MNVIYGVCSWGLGHATRSLPIMRRLVAEGNELTVISSGRALGLLRKELGVDMCSYVDCPDYPAPASKNPRLFVPEFAAKVPSALRAIYREFRVTQELLRKKKYGLIVSDNRYGIYNRFMPSFFISHQLRMVNPMRLRALETGTEVYNQFFFKRYWGVLVPDFTDGGLSGEMSHGLRFLDERAVTYIGPLSDFKRRELPEDVDCFISITGPEPHRTALERTLLAQVKDLSGKVVVTLGKADESAERVLGSATVYSYLDTARREELMNRSKVVVSRSGYSTVMDVAVLGRKALFTPTPNQPEQEYIGKFHNEKGTYLSVRQDRIDLARDLAEAARRPGLDRECDVAKSVENAMRAFHDSRGSPF